MVLPLTRLRFAVQLVTVRAIGMFLADPTAVPAVVVGSVARQLSIADPGLLAGYGKLPVRWKHTAEIRLRYGYREFTAEPGHIALVRWLASPLRSARPSTSPWRELSIESFFPADATTAAALRAALT